MTKEEIKHIVGDAEIAVFLMDEEHKEQMRKFFELLINKAAQGHFQEPYFEGKADAYNNLYKMFDNRMNETDEFVSLTHN